MAMPSLQNYTGDSCGDVIYKTLKHGNVIVVYKLDFYSLQFAAGLALVQDVADKVKIPHHNNFFRNVQWRYTNLMFNKYQAIRNNPRQ